MNISSLEVQILYEISKGNYQNLNSDYLKTSKSEFLHSIKLLKERRFIGGSIFEGNGLLEKPLPFFYLNEKGKRYLRTGRE